MAEDPIASDALFVLRAKVRQARAMSAESRVMAGPQLFFAVCQRMKEGLRDENPGAPDAEIHGLLLQRLKRLRKLDELRRPR